MKRSVDLTENRIFTSTRRSSESNLIADFISNQLDEYLLWDLENKPREISDVDIYNIWYRQENQLILTGTKDNRQRKNENLHYEDGTSCDRCGKDLTLMPWGRHYDLCGRCSNELSTEVETYWKYRISAPQDETSDRVVIEMNRRNR